MHSVLCFFHSVQTEVVSGHPLTELKILYHSMYITELQFVVFDIDSVRNDWRHLCTEKRERGEGLISKRTS